MSLRLMESYVRIGGKEIVKRQICVPRRKEGPTGIGPSGLRKVT